MRDGEDICMMFDSSLPPVVSKKVLVLFTLFVLATCSYYPTHMVLCVCFGFLRLVYYMLPVSLDCSFLIAPLVFPNFYLGTLNFNIIYILQTMSVLAH